MENCTPYKAIESTYCFLALSLPLLLVHWCLPSVAKNVNIYVINLSLVASSSTRLINGHIAISFLDFCNVIPLSFVHFLITLSSNYLYHCIFIENLLKHSLALTFSQLVHRKWLKLDIPFSYKPLRPIQNTWTKIVGKIHDWNHTVWMFILFSSCSQLFFQVNITDMKLTALSELIAVSFQHFIM